MNAEVVFCVRHATCRRWPSASIEEAILDDDFGLSDGGLSAKEGANIAGEPVLQCTDVNVVGNSFVGGPVDRDS